jgi:hypothetical protein
MSYEAWTASETTIALIDFAVGFGNLARSQGVAHNKLNASALAKTAKIFGTGLVVTSGPERSTLGPLYPELLEALDGEPIIHREGQFNCFDHPDFAAAVEKTGRKRVVLAGLMTEGCVLFTALGGLRLGYEVAICADACAGETVETHDLALRRLTMAGVIPTSWASLATDFQVSWANAVTQKPFEALLTNYSPQIGTGYRALNAAAAFGAGGH